jgi:hypothetical protein
MLFAFFLLVGCSRQNSTQLTPKVSATPQAAIAIPATSTIPAATPTEIKATPLPSPTFSATVYVPSISIMGIEVNELENPRQEELFRDSGAVWSRGDYFHWDEIEPVNVAPDEFMWDTVNEAALVAASENNAIPIGIVRFTPVWAQKYPGFSCGPIAEEALGDFAEFMEALVSRYSQPPYGVKYWEIGNEPDVAVSLVRGNSIYGCWGDQADPYYGGGYYGEMLKVIYPAIKAADPEAKVLVGGLLMDCDPENPPETPPNSGQLKDCTPSKFLEGILRTGAGDSFDGVSFHAYDYYTGEEGSYGNAGWHSMSDTTGPVLTAKASYLRSLLNTSGFPEKELLNTELAVLCGRDGREDYCQTEEYANTKAYYVAQANAAAFDSGLRANLWYSLTGWRGSGLVDSKLQPNIAFQAYKVATSQFNEAIYLGKVTQYPGIVGYQFESESKVFWLLWSLDGQERILQLDSAPSAIMDVFGETLENTGGSPKEVKISDPIYIEWHK